MARIFPRIYPKSYSSGPDRWAVFPPSPRSRGKGSNDVRASPGGGISSVTHRVDRYPLEVTIWPRDPGDPDAAFHRFGLWIKIRILDQRD